MRSLFTILLSVLWLASFSQAPVVNLSDKHQQKLNTIKSGHKRMMLYYKFYKKDSTRLVKLIAKRDKIKWDSLSKVDLLNANTSKYLAGIKNKGGFIDSLQGIYKNSKAIIADQSLTKEAKAKAMAQLKLLSKNKETYHLAKNGNYFLKEIKEAEALNSEMKKWWRILKDTTSSDSLRHIAKEKVKQLALTKANGSPQFRGMMQHYKLNGQTPNWKTLGQQFPEFDSLQSIFDAAPNDFLNKAEALATESISKAANLQNFNSKVGQLDTYKKQLSQLQNPQGILDANKEKAKQETLSKFTSNANIQGAQTTMSKLLSKYSSFTNAADLSDGVKRSSLKGKTFKERLVVGWNMNVVSRKPWSFDFTPSLGYRLNTKSQIGVAANYRFTFGDSLKYKKYVSSSNSSTRLFASHDVFKNFFAYTELERSILKNNSQEHKGHSYRYNMFVAVGQRLLIHPKLYMTVTALYNLNGKVNNSSYPNRFNIRIGFQSSDLAFRKKKIYYDRNR